MDIITLGLIGLALSIDSLTISTIISLAKENLTIKELQLPLIFSAFHMAMMIIGYLVSKGFAAYIHRYDHWIAFALLLFLGTKMILERKAKHKTWENTLAISLATSIDALALGITFSLLKENIITASLVVGLIVMAVSYIGLFFGKHLHFLKPKYNYIIGGVVLILIGVHTLLKEIIL